MRALAFALVLVLQPGSLALAQTTYRLAPAEGSELVLLVDKTGLLSGKRHRLVFAQYSCVLVYYRRNVPASSVELTVEAASLQVHDDWVKEKDRIKIRDYAQSDRMLFAARFPQISFASGSVAAGVPPGSFNASGPLSLAGKTHTVTVSATLQEKPGGAIALSGTSRFRLTDFGLKPPSAALGTIGTKDEIAVEFRLAATPSSALP